MNVVRTAIAKDLAPLATVVEEAELFPAEMLPDMIAPAFAGGPEVWRVHVGETGVDGFGFAAPERMTEGTWNLLALGVRRSARRRGVASRLVGSFEDDLAVRGGRLLLIETSSLPEQEGARALYAKLGYDEEARVRDFYAAGEDKIVFTKPLSRAPQ